MPTGLDVITAVTTPFTPSGELDVLAARKHFALLAATTGSLFVAGTTGSFPGPGRRGAPRAVRGGPGRGRAGARHRAHRAPDARQARRLAAAAVAAGARRLVAITPYYLPAAPAEVHGVLPRGRRGCGRRRAVRLLFPERTGVGMLTAQLASLAAECGLAGAKLSGEPWGAPWTRTLPSAPPGFRLYTGHDDDAGRPAERGIAGWVSGLRRLPRAVRPAGGRAGRGQAAEAAAAQAAVLRICAAGYTAAHVKYALSLRGVTGPTARMTAGTVDDASALAIA